MLRYLKKFESFQDPTLKNFYNTSPLDIKKMSVQEITQVIRNTFGTADLVWEDLDWTIVVCDWKKLMGEGTSLSMSARMISEIGDEEIKKVYFHITTSTKPSVIVRSKNLDVLKSAINDLSKYGGTTNSGVNLSAIVNFSKPVHNLSFSSRPIDKFGESFKDEAGLHILHSLVSSEIDLDNDHTLAQLSNILVGQNIIIKRNLYNVQ
jgi:hypothetical protein